MQKRYDIEDEQEGLVDGAEEINEIKGTQETSVEEVEEIDKFSSSSNLDEILIDLVHARRALWDYTIPVKNRTKLKKDALWQEIENILGSLTVAMAKQKWKQLRDSYIKARKKMQGYVRSGSGAEAAHPPKSSFSHYERMRFLDDTVSTVPTINSLQHLLPSSSTSSDYFKDFDANVSVSASCSTLDSVEYDTKSSDNRKIFDQHAQLQETFYEVLSKSSQRERDTVDSFLEVLGDLLRHLPYIKRRNFQKKIFDLTITEEDKMLNEKNV
ncbi:PREDICTED: uncharacterized protein LOC108759203 [Trachymyrmex cornetzi]|uniref:uncharacterized protein LOC108759203 n=1 Tax=Trachymyrmex cornetzi TaxID=471704 RepID=UPI00084EDD68|nr:PREDICTED: uncharacterized protein LOC108759203 [Trachymyrmex cornetzi]